MFFHRIGFRGEGLKVWLEWGKSIDAVNGFCRCDVGGGVGW